MRMRAEKQSDKRGMTGYSCHISVIRVDKPFTNVGIKILKHKDGGWMAGERFINAGSKILKEV